MPGIRPPDQQIEDRRELAISALKLMWPNWKIYDALQNEYDITRKAAADDVGRAREKMKEEDSTSRQDKRSKASAYLEEIMGGAGTAIREKILAIRQYSKLHGLDEQTPLESAPDSDIRVTIDDWRSGYLDQLKNGGARSAGGNGASTNGG